VTLPSPLRLYRFTGPLYGGKGDLKSRKNEKEKGRGREKGRGGGIDPQFVGHHVQASAMFREKESGVSKKGEDGRKIRGGKEGKG